MDAQAKTKLSSTLQKADIKRNEMTGLALLMLGCALLLIDMAREFTFLHGGWGYLTLYAFGAGWGLPMATWSVSLLKKG